MQFNLFCDVCAASQMISSLLTAGGVTVVPVLSCEGLSLRVEAAVHHSDQVMLTESPLCQCHGPQARRLHKRKTQLIKHLSTMSAFTTCWQIGSDDAAVPFKVLTDKLGPLLCSDGELL